MMPKKHMGTTEKVRELAREFKKKGMTTKEIAQLLGKNCQKSHKWRISDILVITDKRRSGRSSKLKALSAIRKIFKSL